MSKLKPCPFCGSEAHYWEDSAYQDKHVIECGSCGTDLRWEYGRDEAYKLWNTRTITRADIPESLVRELQAEALDKFVDDHYRGVIRNTDEYEDIFDHGYNLACDDMLSEAAKLREQKNETI